MSFKTLAERFEESSTKIYTQFSPYTNPGEGGQQPFLSILPNSDGANSRIKNDTQALPIISTGRDQTRVSKFLSSPKGQLFITTQALLQTGNTFVNTKIYNPASVQLSVIPFLHPRRHLVQSLLRPNAPGLLQNTTVNNIGSKFTIKNQLQAFTTGKRKLLPTIASIASTYLATQLKNTVNTITPIPQFYSQSRPEYKVFYSNIITGPTVFDPQPLDQRGLVRLDVSSNIKNLVVTKARETITKAAVTGLNRLISKVSKNTLNLTQFTNPITNTRDRRKEDIPGTFVDAAKNFKNSWDEKQKKRVGENRLKEAYFKIIDNGDNTDSNPVPSSVSALKEGRSGLRDQINTTSGGYRISTRPPAPETGNIRNTLPGQVITAGGPVDIINFQFKHIDDTNTIRFRAFISTIKENVKPEYVEQKYIGRTERFITYSGAKRRVNLSFNIVALSKDELFGVWERVNYLTGLAFPRGVSSSGFMKPPLFKVDIGKIYSDQPCYIDSLDFDFLDETITFDIDREVSQVINVNMGISLLEKRSRYYNSPFYTIAEDLADLNDVPNLNTPDIPALENMALNMNQRDLAIQASRRIRF